MPLTDELPLLRISDICVDKNNPDTMYISVGDYAYVGIGLELDHRKRHTHFGIGVFKTTNGGQTWNSTGLLFEQEENDASLIRRVFIDEEDSDKLLAAGAQGIWKSNDGGDNWYQVIIDTPIWDIERDPNNPNTFYASKAYVFTHDIGECGIIKSYDFGETWIEQGIDVPLVNEAQRIEIAISPSDPNYVYAAVSKVNGSLYGVYSTTDGGENWLIKASSPNIFDWNDGTGSYGIGSYASAILVDPNDKNKVFAGSVNLWGSTDGGTTWNGVSYYNNTYGSSIHCDQHFLAYNPLSEKYYICNDGGLYTTDEILIGSWDDAINMPDYQWPTQWANLNKGLMVTSFYRIGLSKHNENYIIGGGQDNSTFYNNTNNWYNVFSGDGMECIIHPDNPDIIYCAAQRGVIGKSIDGGVSFNEDLTSSIDESGEWVTPYVMHPSNYDILYAGYGNLWKTTNGGTNWSKISNFPIQENLQQPKQITSIAVSKSNPDVIYVSKRPYYFYNELGTVWRTTDGGTSWTNITSNLPNEVYYMYLAVDDTNPNNAWLACAGFEAGLKVYKTTNGGSSWNNISMNLPNLPVNCIVEHQGKQYNPLYVGMDVGVYYTNDTLNDWILFNDQLPNVIISELEIHEETNKIYAATFGRGIWRADLYQSSEITNINNPVYDIQMNIFPNPSNGKFELVINDFNILHATLKIIDITGKLVYSSQIVAQTAEYRKRFNLKLNSGFYYVIVSSNNHRKVKKIVVQ